ncbi:MAG: DUF998 domain-containing protein [Aureispira sp.]
MRKIAPLAGLCTCLILYSVIIFAAIAYIGQQGETYSIFNHFISELGSTKFSARYIIYNSGIVFGAIAFGLFVYGLSAYTSTKLSRIGVFIGVFSAFLCMGVGLVPEDNRIPHLILALGFFFMATLSVSIFSWSILKEAKNPFPRYAALHGFMIPVAFVLFMSMPKGLMAVKRDAGPLFERPEIWALPFLEWIVFAFMTTWILVMSIKMLQLQQQDALPELVEQT